MLKKWEKLLAIYIGTLGLSVMSFMSLFWISGEMSNAMAYKVTHLGMFVLAVVSVIASFFLWQGKKWSHSLLVCLLTTSVVVLLAISSLAVSDLNRSAFSIAGDIALSVAVLSTPLFLLFAIKHPDILRQFGKSVE